MTVFVKDFSRTMQARMLIFGMQVDDDLYRGIRNQPSPDYSSCICPVFFASILLRMKFSSKISQEPFKLECSYLLARLIMTCYIVGLRTSHLLLNLHYICPIFFPSIL